MITRDTGAHATCPAPAELAQGREPHRDRAREATQGEVLPRIHNRSLAVPKLPSGPCKARVNFSI